MGARRSAETTPDLFSELPTAKAAEPPPFRQRKAKTNNIVSQSRYFRVVLRGSCAPVPIGNVIRLARNGESGDAAVRCGTPANCCGRCSSGYSDHERHLKPDSDPSAADHRAPANRAEEAELYPFDRLMFVSLYRLFPNVRDALAVVRPETIIRWHRAGFRAYWRWRSRSHPGRPKVPVPPSQGWWPFFAQPCGRHSGNELVRGPDNFFPASLWSSHPAA